MAEKKLPTGIAEALKERFRNRQIENMPDYIQSLRLIKTEFEKKR